MTIALAVFAIVALVIVLAVAVDHSSGVSYNDIYA